MVAILIGLQFTAYLQLLILTFSYGVVLLLTSEHFLEHD